MAASPATYAQGAQFGLERHDRVSRLRTYYKYINMVLVVLLLLVTLQSVRASGPTLDPFHLSLSALMFPLLYFLVIFNVMIISVDIVELTWLEDPRRRVWRSEDFMANSRPIVAIALIFAILFSNPAVTGLLEDLSASSGSERIDGGASYRINFRRSDLLELSYIAPMAVTSDRENITLMVIEEKDYQVLEDAHFCATDPAVAGRLKWNSGVAGRSFRVNLDGANLGNDEMALVVFNPSNGTTTVDYRLRSELSRPFFGGLVLLSVLFFALNVGWAVGLFAVKRRFVSEFVRRERLRLMRNYTIEEVFLIYKDGRLVCHNTRRLKPDLDKDVLTGMLTAVQSFVKDSFTDQSGHLNELKYGNMKILMENGQRANLAVVISGVEPPALRPNMRNLLKAVHEKYMGILDDWDGDLATVKDFKKLIGNLIPEEKQRLRGVVEEVLLMYRDNRFMMHVSQRGQPDVDDTLLTHMLETVRQRLGESTSSLQTSALAEIPYGNWKIVLEYGVQCYLAVLVSGPEPPDLRPRMRQALEDISTGFEKILVSWDGGTQGILDLRIILEGLFKESLTKDKRKK
jgi:hypothetical protein